MERIPYYILCEILSSVGPINEIYQLSLVCKEWYKAMKSSLHLGTIKGYNIDTKKIWKYRLKFLSHWKLYELNFQGSCIFHSKGFIELINISQPKVLKLSRCHIPGYKFWSEDFCYKKRKHGNENSFRNIEELWITNFAGEYLDQDIDELVGWSNYEYLLELFPNIKRLHAGNTATTQDGVTMIISKLKCLEFLDINNWFSDLGDVQEDSVALNLILSSSLKTLFISLKEQSYAADIIQSKGIKVITQNLGEIFQIVIEEGNTSKLEEWLKSGGDPNLFDSRYGKNTGWENPLVALIEKNIDVDLLKKIIRIMIKNWANFSYEFFCSAISKNMVWLVKLLMDSGCNIWYREKYIYHENEAITLAAKVANETSDFSLLEIIADNGYHKLAFFEKTERCNPYCIAIENENIKLFSFLISKGFITSKCTNFTKPQHLTHLIFHPKILDYALFSGNFSLDQFPFDWIYDGLRYYVKNNKVEEASKLLECLIPMGIKKKEKFLVKNNESVIFDCLYKSLATLAYNHNKGCKQMLECLAEYKFDLNNICDNEEPLFIEAAQYGDVEMMTLFYNIGVNLNRKDSRGFTALHAAANNGHEEAVMQLINWGASKSIRDDNGRTPLELAQNKSLTKICWLLESYVPENGGRKCTII